MIAALVEFDLPRGTTHDEALALFRCSADGWAANRELAEKTYLLYAALGRGGGLYLWPTREAAQRNLGPDYVRMIKERYGSQPSIRLFDAVLRVTPSAGRISEL